MIYFDDIPNDKLEAFKALVSSGERPSVAVRRLYDSIGIDNPEQVALSTPVDILEWGIKNLDIEAISGHVIDTGFPFFENEQESTEFDKFISESITN